MIIEKAKIKDVPEISILWETMVKESNSELTPNTTVWSNHCIEFLNKDNYNLLIAKDKDNNIIGFIDAFIFHEPSTDKIHGIGQHFFVESDYRNTLISYKLYKNILKWGKENNCTVFEFFCFEYAIKMWKKKGYKVYRYMLRR